VEKILTPLNPDTIPEIPANVPVVQQPPMQPAPVETPAANPIYPTPGPSMSASQMGISTQHLGSAGSKKSKKKFIVLAAVLLVLVAAGTFIKNSVTGYANKTLINQGYTYTFYYYKSAQLVTLGDGKTIALKYLNDSIMGVTPTTGPRLTACPNSSSTEVAKITLYGNTVPICEVGDKFFITKFTKDGQTHLATLSYNSAQTSDNYPVIKKMLGSVTVTKL